MYFSHPIEIGPKKPDIEPVMPGFNHFRGILFNQAILLFDPSGFIF
jgi:hypothetical protein